MQAPRRASRLWRRSARGAWLALALLVTGAGGAVAQQIVSARFIGETGHYRHGVLGDEIEYFGLRIALSDGRRVTVGFADGRRIFEDVAPRLWDVTGDGAPEVVVVETSPPVGAQLSVYGLREGAIAKLAATPHIGQANRWLAPLGAADLDGDGAVEIAYVDRPHLAKVLRIWRYRPNGLREVAALGGFTNHRIGWDFIEGGIRDCGQGPEMVLASGDWSRVMAVTFAQTLRARPLAPYSPEGVAAALACR
jgi:hypothetical protein